MEDITIAEIEKSKTETIVIRRAEFHGRHYLDLRAFYRRDLTRHQRAYAPDQPFATPRKPVDVDELDPPF